MPPAGDAEILRLRDRMHQVFSDIAALRMRMDDQDRWRQEHNKQSNEYMRMVDEMRESDRIAEAVAERLRSRSKLELTIAQKVGALVAFLLVAASSVKALFF